MEKKNSITDQKYQVSDRLKVELQELGWKNIGLDEEGHLIGNHDVHGNGMLINKFVKIHIDEQIKYSLKYDTMNENNKETTSNVKFYYAWFPMIVKTWRPKGTTALIWLQKYRVQNGEKSCNYLGFFSKEFD